MMEEVAKVLKCEASGWVHLEVESKSSCHHCSGRKTCGTGVIAQAFSNSTQKFSIKTADSFLPGQLVKIALPESVLLRAAALVYLLPLLGMFVGALLSSMSVFQGDGALADWSKVLMPLLGAVTAWNYGRFRAKKLEAKAQPIILQSLGSQLNP